MIRRYYLSNTNVDCVFHTNHCNKKLFSMNHIKMQFLYERIICIFFVWVSQHDTNQEKDVSTFVPIFTRNVVIMNQSLQFSRKDKKYFIKTHWVVSKINVPNAQRKKSFFNGLGMVIEHSICCKQYWVYYYFINSVEFLVCFEKCDNCLITCITF